MLQEILAFLIGRELFFEDRVKVTHSYDFMCRLFATRDGSETRISAVPGQTY